MNILMVGMRFYNYEKLIQDELLKQGHKVTLINDVSKFHRFYSRLFSIQSVIRFNLNYQKKLLKSLNIEDLELVIVLVGRFLTIEFFNILKQKNKNLKIIHYLWDDIARVENFQSSKIFFDKVFSFDPLDSLNNNFHFLPLFYTAEYSKVKLNKKYTIYSALSNHSSRVRIVNKIINQLNENQKFLFFINLGIFNYIKYFINRVFKEKTRSSKINFVSKPISRKKNIKFMNECIAILDIQFDGQVGLTIRTLEALSSNTKLITTNKSVKFYDFYNNNNILIIDKENPIIDQDFFNTEFKIINKEILSKYSLTTWCKVLLEDIVLKYSKSDLNEIQNFIK